MFTASHWGVYYGRVENGRFVNLRPWEKDPAPSRQLPGVQDVVYSPSRIRYPVVRRAWLEKGLGAAPQTRGTSDFVRVNWDQALDLAANELRRVQAEYGPWAVYGGSYGWKSTGKVHDCVSWLQRLLNLTGGFVGRSGSYSTGALTVIMPHVVGSQAYTEPQQPPHSAVRLAAGRGYVGRMLIADGAGLDQRFSFWLFFSFRRGSLACGGTKRRVERDSGWLRGRSGEGERLHEFIPA